MVAVRSPSFSSSCSILASLSSFWDSGAGRGSEKPFLPMTRASCFSAFSRSATFAASTMALASAYSAEASRGFRPALARASLRNSNLAKVALASLILQIL